MLRGYRLLYVAVVGAALSGNVQAQSVSHHASSKPAAARSQSKPQADAPPTLPASVQNDIHGIASALEAANQKQPSQQEKDNAARYLQSQLDLAKWAAKMFGVGSAEIFITAIGVVLVGLTLNAARASAKEAKRAADEAKRQADAAEATLAETRANGRRQLRAYVNVQGGGASPGNSAEVTIQNFGQTPANELKFWADAIICPADPGPAFEMPQNAKWSEGISLPPGGEFKIMPTYRTRGRPQGVIFAFGQIKYVDAFGDMQTAEFFLRTDSFGAAFRQEGPHNVAT